MVSGFDGEIDEAWRGKPGTVAGFSLVFRDSYYVKFDHTASEDPRDNGGPWLTEMLCPLAPPSQPAEMPASIADGDRLHETGCALCGSPEYVPGSRVYELNRLNLDRENAGALWCGDCFDTHGQLGSSIDAEITRRKKLLAKGSTGSEGRDAGTSPRVGPIPEAPSEPPQTDPYNPSGLNDEELATDELCRSWKQATRDADYRKRVAALRIDMDRPLTRTFTDRMGVVRTWDGRRVK